MGSFDLLKLLKLESLEINRSFEKARLEGKGTPQEASDRIELKVQQFFQKYYPFPFRITKGSIIDSYNNRSNSIDCVIVNPSHPYTFDVGNNKPSILFADGVDYAIEVKPDLSNKREIIRGLDQITSVKKLKRKNVDNLSMRTAEEDRKYLYHKIPAILFCEKSYSRKDHLISIISEYYDENHIEYENHFDIICINNDCIILNDFYLYNTKTISIFESKDRTLAFLLYLLNRYPLSEPRISKPVLSHYLTFDLFNDIDMISQYTYRDNK